MSVHDSCIKGVIKQNNRTKKWLVSNMYSSKLLTDFSFKNMQLNVISVLNFLSVYSIIHE